MWYALSSNTKSTRLVVDAPFRYTRPKALALRDVVGTAVIAIISGFTRHVHINWLRNDTKFATLLELGRIVSEDSVCRALENVEEQELNTHSVWLGRIENRAKGLFHQPIALIDGGRLSRNRKTALEAKEAVISQLPQTVFFSI